MRKNTIITILLLIVATAIFRVVLGFAPQIAVAVFSGALFAQKGNKKLAFILPLISMLVSDLLFQVLYVCNLSTIEGFYGIDQVVNYAMIAGLAFIGFYAKEFKFTNILSANIAAPLVFFLVSNFFVWATNGGWHHTMNFSGLVACYVDGLPFLWKSVASTVVFGLIFFGATYYFNKLELASVYSK